MPAPKKSAAKPQAKKPAAPQKVIAQKVIEAEKKLEQVRSKVEKEAKIVEAEAKIVSSGIAKWRHTSSTEEKIFTILGIILLVWGLVVLRDIIWGLILIILGILFVTGYFTKNNK